MGGLRRAEVSALEWRDVADASDGDGVLITVRTSKTNQEGDTADVRYLKNGGAKAIRTVRADRPDAAPTDRVVGLCPLQIQRRFTAAVPTWIGPHADRQPVRAPAIGRDRDPVYHGERLPGRASPVASRRRPHGRRRGRRRPSTTR